MKEDVTIFHNLEDDKIYVRVPLAKETHYQLQNLAGRVLQEAFHSKNLHDFDLTGLKDGIYFVIIEQDGLIKSKKVVLGYHP
jgi:hypothetical protein